MEIEELNKIDWAKELPVGCNDAQNPSIILRDWTRFIIETGINGGDVWSSKTSSIKIENGDQIIAVAQRLALECINKK